MRGGVGYRTPPRRTMDYRRGESEGVALEESGTVVDFSTASKLVARGVGAVKRIGGGFRELTDRYNHPGPDIKVEPFTAGTVTTGAFLSKLATKVFANARAQANDAAARTNQDVRNRYLDAEIGALNAKAKRPVEGVKTQAQLDAELSGAADLTKSRIAATKALTAGRLKRNAQAPKEPKAPNRVPAAAKVVQDIDAQLSDKGPIAHDAQLRANTLAERYLTQIRNHAKDPVAAQNAARVLGLPSNAHKLINDQTLATSNAISTTVGAWKARQVARVLAVKRAEMSAKRSAATGVIDEAAGLDQAPDAPDPASDMLDEFN